MKKQTKRGRRDLVVITMREGGRKLEKIKQTDKHQHNKTTKIVWQYIYTLKVLLLEEDYG
jgi:hypothetical protein